MLFFSFSSFFGTQSLCAAGLEETNDNIFEYNWVHDDEYVFFVVNLRKELEFSDDYYYMNVVKGLGCVLTCQPKQGVTLQNPNSGKLIEKIKLLVFINDNTCTLVFEEYIKKSSEEVNERVGVTSVNQKLDDFDFIPDVAEKPI